MRNYNNQYERYYSKLKNNFNRGNRFNNSIKSNNKKENYFVRRIIRDLTGVLVLFLFVVICKFLNTPKTQMVYNYSKNIVNENYDFNNLRNKVSAIDYYEVQNNCLGFIDKIKSKVTGGKTIKSRIKNEFILPVQGSITSKYGYRKDPITGDEKFHKGVDIGTAANANVKLCADGIVEECGEKPELGKYIIVDHGDGIETKYYHLNEIAVKNQQKLKKGQVIGKVGKTGKATGYHLHLQLDYMGESINPQEYFNWRN